MKTLALLFIGMTSAFLAECCQGDRTTFSSKNCEKYSQITWHDIYVATETGWQTRGVVCYSTRLRKSDREKGRNLRRDSQILPQ
jgi:hypothetical protein